MAGEKDAAGLLRQLRAAKRLTQTELGDRLGVSQDRVSRWELGLERPSADILIKLAKISQGIGWVTASAEGAVLSFPEEFYRLAGVGHIHEETVRKATANIIRLIRNENPAAAERLQAEVSGMGPDEALDRATQTAISFRAESAPQPSALTAEDRKLLDSTRKAIEKFNSWPKGEKSK